MDENNNIGHYNIGTFNVGWYNSGRFNVGDHNIGNCNIGNNNIGAFNVGNSNNGDFNLGRFNSCDKSTGFFCAEEPKVRLFDVETDMAFHEFIDTEWYKAIITAPFVLTEWIFYTESEMQEDEDKRKDGGYLKTYTYEEACANWWDVLPRVCKDIIKTIPNFSAKKFKEITGIDVGEEESAFERAIKLNMELEALHVEKEEIDKKIKELGDFIRSEEFGKLVRQKRELIDEQLLTMVKYSSILNERILFF